MFATRDIAAGDLIVAERPLVIYPTSCSRRSEADLGRLLTKEEQHQVAMSDTEKILEALIARMHPEDKEAFMALPNSHQNDGSGPILGRIRTNGFGEASLMDQGMHSPK